jgi:hypothetical protein
VAKVTGGKRFILTPDKAPDLLRSIGLLNADATMSADCVRKFSQINHMLSLLRPALDDLIGRHKTVRVLDAGCGNSYLTFLLAWYCHDHAGHPCQIVGIDFNAKVIESSRQRAESLGWGNFLRFSQSAIDAGAWSASYGALFPAEDVSIPRPHLLVALHACDTATDQAIALGVHSRADVIAVAPCCHAELAGLWSKLGSGPGEADHPLQPVFSSPNIRRDAAAVMTDTLRMLLIRRSGYEVTATEFVPSDHTPKNRLLLCIRRGQYSNEAGDRYDRLRNLVGGGGIALESLLEPSRKDTADTLPRA